MFPRKALTYASCFLQNSVLPNNTILLAYLSNGNIDNVRRFARFRLGSHFLVVETGKFLNPYKPWSDRICTRCSADYVETLECGVDDEHHLIFDCEAFSEARQELDLSECESVHDCMQDVDCFKFIVRCMSTLDQEDTDDRASSLNA